MISKKTVKDVINAISNGEGGTPDLLTFIDEVYDSIGSCGECYHFSETDLRCLGNYCENLDKGVGKNDFCSDFERKD